MFNGMKTRIFIFFTYIATCRTHVSPNKYFIKANPMNIVILLILIDYVEDPIKIDQSNQNRPMIIGYPIVIGLDRAQNFKIQLGGCFKIQLLNFYKSINSKFRVLDSYLGVAYQTLTWVSAYRQNSTLSLTYRVRSLSTKTVLCAKHYPVSTSCNPQWVRLSVIAFALTWYRFLVLVIFIR